MSYRNQHFSLPRQSLVPKPQRASLKDTLKTVRENVGRAVRQLTEKPHDVSPGTENLLMGLGPKKEIKI